MAWWAWVLVAAGGVVEMFVHGFAVYGWKMMGRVDGLERARERAGASLARLDGMGGDIRFGLPHHAPKAETWHQLR